jgi:hypothetical protein
MTAPPGDFVGPDLTPEHYVHELPPAVRREPNLEGETITDIRDTGEDPADPDVRLYRTRAEQDFHTDGADGIGLLSLQTGRSGGASRIVSSVRVYPAVREQRPDLAPLLLQPWFFRIPGAPSRAACPRQCHVRS